MIKILSEVRIRPKNEITVPIPVRTLLKLNPGDFLRFEFIDGKICIFKVATRKINSIN